MSDQDHGIKGLYYHYKHDPTGAINNYAYEVIGVGLHTETEERFVVYRPLYDSKYLGSADYFIRPFEMFFGDVDKGGIVRKRFTKISDPELVSKLSAMKSSDQRQY